MLPSLVGYVGHKVHVVRSREVGTLLRWAGDLTGKRLLDVAGGDGYWAAEAEKLGAKAVCLDLMTSKLQRGLTLPKPPGLVEADALRLPFADGSFDVILSVCAIEHFDDGAASIAEMSRVLKPGGVIVMSADTLSRSQTWPNLLDAHRRRYHVKFTYTHKDLEKMFVANGLVLEEHDYLFRTARAERLYLTLSAKGGKVGWNAAAPLSPLVALSDRRAPNEQGSVVLVRARKA